MVRNNLIGVVDKIKCLSMYPNVLLRFTLIIGNDTVNCLTANKMICHQLLFFQNGEKEVAVYGHYNVRKQLIVEKLAVRHSEIASSPLFKECGA